MVGGAISPRYTGTSTVESPDANPVTKRAGTSHGMDGAQLIITPPARNIHMFQRHAPRRPRRLAMNPPAIAPKGPPTAKDDTARDHMNVECAGNTTAAGLFMTPVLNPFRKEDKMHTYNLKRSIIRYIALIEGGAPTRQASIRGVVITISSTSNSCSSSAVSDRRRLAGTPWAVSLSSLSRLCRDACRPVRAVVRHDATGDEARHTCRSSSRTTPSRFCIP